MQFNENLNKFLYGFAKKKKKSYQTLFFKLFLEKSNPPDKVNQWIESNLIHQWVGGSKHH